MPAPIFGVDPFGDNVLVRLEKAPEKSAGGILLPDSKNAPVVGVVVAVGPGRYDSGVLVPMRVRPQQRVLLDRGALDNVAEKLQLGPDREEHALLREAHVLGSVR